MDWREVEKLKGLEGRQLQVGVGGERLANTKICPGEGDKGAGYYKFCPGEGGREAK